MQWNRKIKIPIFSITTIFDSIAEKRIPWNEEILPSAKKQFMIELQETKTYRQTADNNGRAP